MSKSTLEKERLPPKPRKEDLLPFLGKRLRPKRLRKKFLDHFEDYLENPRFVPFIIACEFSRKRWRELGEVLSDCVYDTLTRESFTRQILKCEPIGSEEAPVVAIHEDEVWTN